MAQPKRERGNPIGPTARAVAHNVKKIRQERGFTLEDLSQALEDVGQPISNSALSKLERGIRRVDVDDLTALAATLDVSPWELMLPQSEDKPVLTGIPEGVSLGEASGWLHGKGGISHQKLGKDWLDTAGFYAYRIDYLTKSIQNKSKVFDEHGNESDPVLERTKLLAALSRAIDRAVIHFRNAGQLSANEGYEDLPSAIKEIVFPDPFDFERLVREAQEGLQFDWGSRG